MTYNRAEFLARLRELADEMESDHEDCTGVTSHEKHTFQFWMEEIESCEENTRP